MAFNMGSLVFRMAADVSSLKTDMAEAKNLVADTSKGIQSSMAMVKGGLAGLTIGKIILEFKNLIDSIDDLVEISAGLNVGALALADLRKGAEYAGVGVEQLDNQLDKLNRHISDAVVGSKKSRDMFKALGVEFQNADGSARGLEGVLKDVADSFNAHANGAEKSALAQLALGRASYKTINWLNQGSDALKENSGLTQEAIEAAVELRTSMDELNLSWEQGKNILVSGIVPELNIFVNRLKELYNAATKLKDLDWGGGATAKRLLSWGKDFLYQKEAGERKLAEARAADPYFDGAEFVQGAGNPGNRGTRFRPPSKEGKPPKQKELEALSQNVEDAKQYENIFTRLLGVQEKTRDLNEEQSLLFRIQNGELSTLSKTALEILINKAREVDLDERQKELRESGGAAIKAETDNLETIKESIKAQEESNAVLGLTEEQQSYYNVELQKTILAKLKLKQQTLEIDPLMLAAVTAEVEAQEKLVKLMEEGAGKKASIDAALKAKEAWDDAAKDIAQSLTDAMVQGFGEGKSIAKEVGDWIKNYFKTTVARGIADAMTGMISGMLRSMAGGVASMFGNRGGGGLASMFGGGGAAAGGGGGGFNLSSIGSLFNGSSSITSMLGGVGTAAGNFAGGFGSTIAGWTGAEAGAWGGLSASGSALGAGNIAGALGSAMPYVAAAYALYRIISGVGTGRSRGPAYQEFSSLTGSGAEAGMWTNSPNPAGGQQQGGHYNAQLRAVLTAIDATTRSLGGTINSGTQFGMYTSTSPDGLGAQVVGSVRGGAGGALYDYNFNGSNEDKARSLGILAPNMILAGLKDSNLPVKLKEYFNSITQEVSQETLDVIIKTASAAHAMADAFKQLGGPFSQIQNLSVETRGALAELAGGIEAFLQKVQGYYSAFYTQEEQQALSLLTARRELEKAGIGTSGFGGETREDALRAFRDAVDNLNLNTEEGRKQFAAYMNAAAPYASGADLLAATGMSLEELTANAPNYAEIVTATVQSTADQTMVLSQAIADGATRVVEAMQAQQINVDVRTNQPSYVEVGYNAGFAPG